MSVRNIGAVFLAIGVLFLGFAVDRTDFWQVAGGFFVSYVGFAILPKRKSVRYWIALGLVLRFVLVFSFPLLSDDIYRFIWDGQLLNNGLNPFDHLPAHYLEAGNSVPGLTRELYGQLNSPEYYTIYPPVAQVVFTLSTWLAAGSWYGAAVVMKGFLFAAEIGTLVLLWQLLPRWGRDRHLLLLYWLNPLIIVEIVGNLHFEGVMIFFLLLGLRAFHNFKWGVAGAGFALSVAGKLLPLMFLPFLIVRLLWPGVKPRDVIGWPSPTGWWAALKFGSAFLGVLLLCFLPLFSAEFLAGFGNSLDLYFRKFEFNASLYYLARAYGYYELGWNQIARFGPLLARAAVVIIFLLAALDAIRYLRINLRARLTHAVLVGARRFYVFVCAPVPADRLPKVPAPTSTVQNETGPSSLPLLFLFAFTIYLFCATTVHPWYLSLPIVLCCFGPFRYPILWSFLITLTYVSYTTNPYRENLWIVAVEYLSVTLFLTWELYLFCGKRGDTNLDFKVPNHLPDGENAVSNGPPG